jgi:hypothetical protein
MATQDEASAAWRLFTRTWLPIALMFVVLVVCIAVTDFSIKSESLLVPFGFAALFAGAAYGYALTWRIDSPVPFALGSLAQLTLITVLTTPLTYVAAAAAWPLQDANFAYLDRMLGFDWQAYFHFIYEHPALITLEYLAYAMIGWPMVAIPIVLAVKRHYRRLQQFTLACAMTLIATTIVSSLIPAIGTYDYYGITLDVARYRPGNYLSTLHDLPLLRDGSLRVLDINELSGIVAFPSFHAAAAVLYLWALWGVWWMRPVALIANLGMLLATPVGGGHYFIDVFAGIGFAVLAISASRRISECLNGLAAQPLAAQTMSLAR